MSQPITSAYCYVICLYPGHQKKHKATHLPQPSPGCLSCPKSPRTSAHLAAGKWTKTRSWRSPNNCTTHAAGENIQYYIWYIYIYLVYIIYNVYVVTCVYVYTHIRISVYLYVHLLRHVDTNDYVQILKAFFSTVKIPRKIETYWNKLHGDKNTILKHPQTRCFFMGEQPGKW